VSEVLSWEDKVSVEKSDFVVVLVIVSIEIVIGAVMENLEKSLKKEKKK